MEDKDKVKTIAVNSGTVEVLPWTDDSEQDILEIIQNEENKHLLTPANLGYMLTKCPIDQLEEAWNHIASPSPRTPDETSITTWSPLSFKDVDTRSYHRYHPAIMETGAKSFHVLSFDPGTLTWIALPPLNFLPPGCERVVAGSAGEELSSGHVCTVDVFACSTGIHDFVLKSGHDSQAVMLVPGLVVMDGGEQPGSGPIMLWGELGVPNARFWESGDAKKRCGGQSLVCVANPLTREFILLPPIPSRRVHGKIAKFIFSNMERTGYHLVIAGWDTIKKKNQSELADTLCVVVYSSEKQGFVHANYIERARPGGGRSGMAIINYGVYVGGQRVGDEEICDVPAIFYFNISGSRRACACFDFHLVNIAERAVQAPKVVQAGPNRVFAVTRYAQLPTILWIVEVELQGDGTPTGCYKKLPNAVMPGEYYQQLFPTEDEALLNYECSSADGEIAFKVYSERNLVALYSIHKCEWKVLEFPCQPDQKTFQLCDGCYEPVFIARP